MHSAPQLGPRLDAIETSANVGEQTNIGELARAGESANTAGAVGLTVIVPCFNEADGIENLRARLDNWVRIVDSGLSWEVLFVDDGSADTTSETIIDTFGEDQRFRLVRHAENRGLTAALTTGFAHARGERIACIDADCTYDPAILIDLLAMATSGYDVVTASPYIAGGRVENVAAWRIGLSRIASRMYRSLMHSKLSCYTCCVRIYEADLIRNCPTLVSTGFVGVTELLWHLDRQGARIGEVPAVLRPRETGVSKMRTMRTMMRHLRLMLRIVLTR